jgi:hypothetical protein
MHSINKINSIEWPLELLSFQTKALLKLFIQL